MFLGNFPRRVRAQLGDRNVLDTRRGRLLHETGLLPVLYVPDEDVDTSVLVASDHHTSGPVKGRAQYWHLQVGERTVRDAAWTYPDPPREADWLRGHTAFRWDAMDAWYDEAERVEGHLRDPFHRVDVRDVAATVRVRAGADLLAESSVAKVVSETGLPNRYYLPSGDVRVDLEPSTTSTVCPYKGTASYWSAGGRRDVAWSYERPHHPLRGLRGGLVSARDPKNAVVPQQERRAHQARFGRGGRVTGVDEYAV